MGRSILTKAIVSSLWTSAKYSDRYRCIHRLKPLASYLLLLVPIIRWKKCRDQMRKANLKSRMMDLPDDVIESILLRLPTKSICCIQCASKAFSSIIDNSLFASLHMSTLLNNGMNSAAEVPQLMFFNHSWCWTTYRFQIQLQPLEYNGKSDFKKPKYGFPISKILSISFFDVEFVFRNLIFLKSVLYGGPSCLLNPFKGEVLMIPTTETKHTLDWYGMGFDSTTNTYKIVHAYKENNQLAAKVFVLRPRSSCFWRVIQSVPPCELMSSKSVCAYGDMHWLAREPMTSAIGIISFDFKKEEFCWTPHPTLKERDYMRDLNDYYFLNMKGSLTIVDVSSGKFIEIWVMKDYGKKEWSLDYKINNMQKFVEYPRNGYVNHTCGEWEKGIFFETYEPHVNHTCGTLSSTVHYLLDLQHTSMKRIENAPYRERILSYKGSFISLKDYGDLVEPTTQNNVWNFS